ncbi:MAG: primosomal protein N' [Bacteroidales bacterium]|nr:primosomal protein N' [Bacteroidales bacterium]MBN2820319.1 primosomal protein N' [Bacteroidales bacterium]
MLPTLFEGGIPDMQVHTPKYVDVILPVSVPKLYTYNLPENISEEEVRPGMRVCVQFGKRKLFTALVVKIHSQAPAEYETKEIIALLDDYPVVLDWQIKFWEWIAEYYMCTRGEVLNAALPVGLRPEGQTQVFLNEIPESGIDLKTNEENIVKAIENNPGITIDKLTQLSGRKEVMPVLRQLLYREVISFSESLRENYKPKLVPVLHLHENLKHEKILGELMNHLEKRAPKQLQALLAFLDLSGFIKEKKFSPVLKSLVISKAKVPSAAVKALVDRDVFIVEEVESSRFLNEEKTQADKVVLNEYQEKALKEIKETFENNEVTLLRGVTSSGKTEIYIHLIEEQLGQGKQVLYLLPEIALTTQIILRLQNVFGNRIGIYHSKYNDAERVEVWNNLLGYRASDAVTYDIILGVRSSVFLPYKNLGLIIVDEEHENTYKQFDPAPRYHARDTAIVLASLHKAKVLLGTATPSVESYLNAKTGKYGYVELLNRYLDIQLPEIKVADVRRARKKKQMSGHFSPDLITEIQQALNNNEQIILFQNRRGFAPYLECADCGWIPGCKHCDVSLTYHKLKNRLNCHYCGYNMPAVVRCNACGSHNIQTRGFGTEKVEDDIQLIFPEARLLRLDMDTTRKKRSYDEIIDKFSTGQVDVLIGTQMVSKGLDFDNVSVVGILNADNMLNFPDFRAFERSFQMMAQVSGRAGRKKKRGKVIIQTGEPEHSIIKQVVNNDIEGFFNIQLSERKKYIYPPYIRLVKIIIKHGDSKTLREASNKLASELRKLFGNRVLGPEPPVIGRIQNWYINHILIKLNKSQNVGQQKKQIADLSYNLKTHTGYSGLQLFFDVDPF